MVDTLLANVETDDLRAILRATLASCPPSTASAFTAAARKRLVHLSSRSRPCTTSLFDLTYDGLAAPTPSLHVFLRRSRALYGSGMGFTSLRILTDVVRETLGLRWDLNGETAVVLAAVDADISQAYQSAKEELGSGRMADLNAARAAVQELAAAVNESANDCELWGGDFPFEQALAITDYWKL
ncbi:hypothetical protein BDW22DRAFT_1083506 [Trametopsis cervina]|nr:hypothetical protein BDW22DRAFT_1083506 [Trametopsis cervina]